MKTYNELNELTRNAGITSTRDGWDFNGRNYIAETMAEAVEMMIENAGNDGGTESLKLLLAELEELIEAENAGAEYVTPADSPGLISNDGEEEPEPDWEWDWDESTFPEQGDGLSPVGLDGSGATVWG